MLKLFAFDLDGTSLIEHAHLSARNQAAFEALYEKKVVLVPATGRILNFIPDSIMSLKGLRYLITSNGASVFDLKENKQIFSNGIPSAKAAEVQEILEDYHVYVEYYDNGKVKLEKKFYSFDLKELGVPEDRFLFFQKEYEIVDSYQEELRVHQMKPEKINLPYIKQEIYGGLWKALNQVEGIHLTSSVSGNIEINQADCHKGNALKFLSEYLKIERDEVVSIGDNNNDLEMLAFAGVSFAMGNATEQAKKTAKYQTDFYDQDGLAKAVESIINQK